MWSVPSHTRLRREALDAERWNMLHPAEKPRKPYVASVLEDQTRPVIAVTDYMKVVADQISRWVPGGLTPLGTDGFGRSDTREALRRFFEVDAESIAVAALSRLAQRSEIDKSKVQDALKRWDLDPEKANPAYA